MPSLSYRSAAKIAAREMRSSRGKFFFVVLSVAIGVAALTGVRGFSSSFRATLLTRARSIMAADLSARTTVQPTPAELKGLDEIEQEGIRLTPVTELLSMASNARNLDPLLVSLKAVDPNLYPFYGTVELDPAGSLKSVLDVNSVVVADDLLVRLKMHVGDNLKLGNKQFRIASIVTNEPDRLSSSFAAGPPRPHLPPGPRSLRPARSRLARRPALSLQSAQAGNGAPISDTAVGNLKARLIKLLPEAQVTDYRETNPALTSGLDQATSLLSLMSLVALVLGAVGVAMAMRAHLQQRLDTIAIMKSLGASSPQIIKIYLIQTLLLGLAGGLLGVLLGVGVQLAFPYLLESLINIRPDLHIDPRAMLAGLGAGILTTLLFTLPPLLDIRGIRPILILRRAVDEEDQPFFSTLLKRLRKNVAQILAFAVILGGLTFIASRVSDSRTVGRWFSVGLVGVLAVLLIVSYLVLAALKYFLSRTRLHLPSALRHGLANLYRPWQSLRRPARRARHGRHADHARLPHAARRRSPAARLLRAQPAQRLPHRCRQRRDRRHAQAARKLPRRHRPARTPPRRLLAHPRHQRNPRRFDQDPQLPPSHAAEHQPHLLRRARHPEPPSSKAPGGTPPRPPPAISTRSSP